ncbi:MAG: ORF6N domain-containing protein [Bacilli bacterium]|nr:ORF6N domain-containing protein [Bacilli bacterium]
MNELTITENLNIENMIYEIRGKQVMLDSDLAKLYKCKSGTKVINQAVSRNKDRFPEDFYFKLTKEEYYSILRSQNVTLELKRGEYNKYLPHVFTEQGVAMLSSVLRTEVASAVSIRIMRAFVAMRHYIGTNFLEQKYINNQVMKNTEDIKALQELFNKFDEKESINEVYSKGQIYDAYSKILDIFNKANKEIIIVDRYADKIVLDMVRNLKVNVIIITKENNKLSKLDISKYNQEYNNLKVIYSDDYHDRYFILDRTIIYHSGTSINNAGNRLFSINILTDKFAKDYLINKIIENIKR